MVGEYGVALVGSTGEITNHGIIDGRSTGVVLSGSSGQLVNYGTVEGGRFGGTAGVSAPGSSGFILNYGSIQGGMGILTSGNGTYIYNGGSIVGTSSVGINALGVETTIVNDGDIRSEISAGVLSDQGLALENNGAISGQTGVSLDTSFGGSDHVVLNSGTITGVATALFLEGGAAQSITNSGVLQSADSWAVEVGAAGFSDLVLINSGIIQSTAGFAFLGTNEASASDVLVSSGAIFGNVSLVDGADFFQLVGDGFVAGTVELGAGDDIAFGASADDVIDGSSGADYISGGGGSDALDGGDGLDIILGGDGADSITGGAGIDFLLGEEGADVFYFRATTDSPTGGDVTSILDFEQGADLIDLYTIETSIAFLGNDAFTGSGDAELRTTNVGGVLSIVDFDVDGNGTSDMQIIVYGALDMTRADFGL